MYYGGDAGSLREGYTVSSNTGSEKTRRCIAELWNEFDFRVSGIATGAEVPEATMVAPIKMTAKLITSQRSVMLG
jgi:hypothetical protein